MAKVSLKNVSKVYSGTEAVSDVSLEIANRAFVVLTGPSGCGKTTILRGIAGLETLSKGDVSIGDRRVNDLKPPERDVAMVFSGDALYPQMSVRQNIGYGLKLRKFSATEITRRVQDSAATLGIEDFLERLPKELSRAQRQRVSIARAAARQPKVILFDEPLSDLDPGARARMRADIRSLHDRLQATVIYATRDASEAMALGESLVVLKDGCVQQSDSVRAIYDAPANLFVAGFVGTPPMNLIHGTLKAGRDSLLFTEAGEGTIQVRMPQSERTAAAGFEDKPVVLGIRPGDVGIVSAPKGQESGESFPAVVDFVETMDGETVFYLQTGAHTIVCRQPGAGSDQPSGRRARFQFHLEKAQLFDPVSTLRIPEL